MRQLFVVFVTLLLGILPASWAFLMGGLHVAPPQSHYRTYSHLSMGFLEDIIKPKTSVPKVKAPDNFQAPEPKPLAVTRSSDLPDIFKSTAALAVRLGTGAFVLGWKIDTIFANEKDDSSYSLKLGPFRIRDSSSVLANAPRPEKPLILYEYDASPFCKRGKWAIITHTDRKNTLVNVNPHLIHMIIHHFLSKKSVK